MIRRPSGWIATRVQPATHTCAALAHTDAGGSQSPSLVQATPPEHSPLCGSQVAAPTHKSGSATQPGTQRPSGPQMVEGGAQSALA